MFEKCIVHKCRNHKGEGSFSGDICLPCHIMLVEGKVSHTDSFLGDLVKQIELLKAHRRELLKMALDNLDTEYPEYKLKYDHLKRKYDNEKRYLMEKFRD